MNIKGKIVQIVEEQSGESAKGPWRKQEYILQTDGEYPKKVCFMIWNDKIDEFAIKENENLDVSIDLESREYNGRWYTDVKAWKVVRDDDDMTPHNHAKGDGFQPQQNTLENFNDEF
tara:strand:- start:148 stop:498 length:351 start_codon:yes stop_codon:yes gene_type:complete